MKSYTTLIELDSLTPANIELTRTEILSKIEKSHILGNSGFRYISENILISSLTKEKSNFDSIYEFLNSDEEIKDWNLLVIDMLPAFKNERVDYKTRSYDSMLRTLISDTAKILGLKVVIIALEGTMLHRVKLYVDSMIKVTNSEEGSSLEVLKCRATDFELDYIIDNLGADKGKVMSKNNLGLITKYQLQGDEVGSIVKMINDTITSDHESRVEQTRIEFHKNDLMLYQKILEELEETFDARIVAHHNYGDVYFLEINL